MIIKCIRVSAAQGVRRLVRHLFDGDENDNIRNVQGSPADVADMHEDARERGRTYCVRHWIVSPAEPTTEQQLRQIVAELATEFGFEPQNAVIVEHAKPRAVPDAFDLHWHVLVGEVDPVSGRVLSSSHDYARNELIARRAEFAFGHEAVLGVHTMAVIAELRNRGMTQQADQLAALVAGNGSTPRSAFSHAQHQEAKRDGIDLPALRAVIKEAWAASTDCEGLLIVLGDAGLSVQKGTRAGTWVVVNEDGALVGALDRLAGVRKAAIRQRLEGHQLATPKGPSPHPQTPEGDLRGAVVSLQAALKQIEDEAQLKIGGLPQLPHDPPALIDARKRNSANVIRLSQADQEQNERAHALAMIERQSPRWWWLPAWRRKWTARRQVAIAACDAAEATVNHLRIEALNTSLTVQRHENALREEQKRAVERAVKLDHAAQQQVSLIRRAGALLDADPMLATKGIDHLLRAAERASQEPDDAQTLDFLGRH